MKRLLLSAAAVLLALEAFAQGGRVMEMEGGFLRQLQKRDSVLIADQLEWGARLDNVAEGTMLGLPELSGGVLPEGVETVGGWIVDTLATRKEKGTGRQLSDIEVKRLITSFDEGEYHLPPFPLLRTVPGGRPDTLLFEAMVLDVKTMPVDTATFVVHDIKGQIGYPLTFRELLPWIGGAVLLAALAWLAVWLIRRRGSRKGGSVSADPPHIVALREIDRYRGNKYWTPDRQKTFYSGITDALRGYIAALWGVGAMEMTTAEIFDGLKGKELPEDLYSGAKNLFERADFVKFAKYTASDEENASVVPFAVRFVTDTYRAVIDKEEKEGGNVL